MRAPRDFKSGLYEQLARIGKTLGNPHRLELLELLAQGERTVESLAADTDLSVANASQHLQALRHGLYYYVPGLLRRFTTAQINALIAPRAHLGLAGLQGRAHAGRGTRHHRSRADTGLRRGGPPGAMDAAPLRRRPHGDAGGTR